MIDELKELKEFDAWFRKKHYSTSSATTTMFLIISDLLTVMLSFGAGFFLVNLVDYSNINFRSFVTYWPYLLVFIVFFIVFGLYPGVSVAPADELKRFVSASLLSHGEVIIARYIMDQVVGPISIAFAISFVVSIFFFLFGRSIMRTFLRKTKLGVIPAVVFGAGDSARRLIDKMLDKKSGYRPVLILDTDPNTGSHYRDIPVLHDTSIGEKIVATYNIKMAVVAFDNITQSGLSKVMRRSVSAFRYSILIPDFSQISSIWTSVRDFDGILGFATNNNLNMPWNLFIKRFIDILIVTIGGLILLPALLFVALLVKCTSKGPVLYGQPRIGKNGLHYKMWKFRSMRIDAEARLEDMLKNNPEARKEWDENRKIKNEPRVTPFGKFIRRYSIDEFPQFLNVLAGEMSLVGPRPLLLDEVPKYGKDFTRIVSVIPGLTGLWQVSGRSNTDYSERIAFGTYYLQSWSVWLDIWILYKTVSVVINGRGAY
ncbi:undecaprenyl-phosphate galactose phosphotransferase WbaP [Spirochaetia bacterium]|nr:undecaprenyl-phosphate galactose phosphotransferase WbaP [Spirochaetia bacterium]